MATATGPKGLSILVIDDDPKILNSVGTFLRARRHRVFEAETGEEALKVLGQEPVDLVIADVVLPGIDGFAVLRHVQERHPGTEVVMITGHNDTRNAFRAVREGAFDYFTKPFKVEELNNSLRRTVRFQTLQKEKSRIKARLDQMTPEDQKGCDVSAIVGESSAIQALREQIQQIGASDATSVLICGETGTGKDLVARAIHSQSSRAGGPFYPVNCSAIPPGLFESTFYGHEQGSFTDARETRKGHFELAEGGALFLDEIGDLDPGMQAKLLRALEERLVRPVGGTQEIPVDVRVVSATNQDLPLAVAEGRFREDLLYRLNTFTLRIPPLRERREDILPLADHFLTRYTRELRKSIEGFSWKAAVLLQAHPLPGNVRMDYPRFR